jgi:hypothetical protein
MQPPGSDVHVFVDTNLLLHYRFPADVDWRALTKAASVVVVFAPIVVRELDKHKHATTSKVRKRAASVLRRLHGLLETHGARGPLADGVTYVFLGSDPRIDYEAHGLQTTVPDDILIAGLVQHRETHAEVRLSTADLGLRVKASTRRIMCVTLSNEDALPEEETDEERELRALRMKVLSFESAQPSLALCFANTQTHCSFRLQLPNIVDVDARVDEARDILEYKKEVSKHSTLGLFPPGKDEFLRYEKECRQYLVDLREHLDKQNTAERRRARTIKTELVFRNDGTTPASDVDLFLSFAAGLAITAEDNAPLPEEPEPPSPPEHLFSSMVEAAQDGRFDLMLRRGPAKSINTRHNESVEWFELRRLPEGTTEGHWRASQLKHGLPVLLPPLYVELPSQETTSFHAEYKISAANLPELHVGQLHFRIEE